MKHFVTASCCHEKVEQLYIKSKWGHSILFNTGRGREMVFNANFNNISVISWWSVLLEKEPGIPEENH